MHVFSHAPKGTSGCLNVRNHVSWDYTLPLDVVNSWGELCPMWVSGLSFVLFRVAHNNILLHLVTSRNSLSSKRFCLSAGKVSVARGYHHPPSLIPHT